MVSWTEKPKATDSEAVKGWFADLKTQDGKKAKLTDYADWKLGADFDTSVFFVDGSFDGKRYAAFMKAVADVAAKLGVENPLSVTKTLVPKPDFATRRFVDFDPAQNVSIQNVLPMTVTLKAVAGADE
jgi:hypothetical protein